MMRRAVHVIPTVRMEHVCPPIVVHTDPSSFRTTVQELTGFKRRSNEPEQDSNVFVDKGTASYPALYDHTLYDDDDHINACHCDQSYDHTDESCIHSIYAHCDELIMGSHEASLSPTWVTSSSSYNDSFMSQQQQEDTRIWDSQEANPHMLAYSANACAYSHKLPSPKKLRLEYGGDDLQHLDNEILSTNFMDYLSMQEETLDFLGLDEEHSSHHLLQDLLSMEAFSLISAL